MRYQQITPEERYTLALLRKQGYSDAEIARLTGRHRSTIGREFRRNCTRHDGAYRPSKAQEHANARRWTPRRNTRFGPTEWALIDRLLAISSAPNRSAAGSSLSVCSRSATRRSTCTSGATSSVAGNSGAISASLQTPQALQHLREARPRPRETTYLRTPARRREPYGDRSLGDGHGARYGRQPLRSEPRRASHRGSAARGKLRRRNVAAVNARLIQLIEAHPALFKTITADNGSEFHGFAEVEHATGVPIYFATPYHSWERGTSENSNGLIRQYVPKRTSMKGLTQAQCNAIANSLNNRPRKRHGFRTPLERLADLFRIV